MMELSLHKADSLQGIDKYGSESWRSYYDDYKKYLPYDKSKYENLLRFDTSSVLFGYKYKCEYKVGEEHFENIFVVAPNGKKVIATL